MRTLALKHSLKLLRLAACHRVRGSQFEWVKRRHFVARAIADFLACRSDHFLRVPCLAENRLRPIGACAGKPLGPRFHTI
jgi:hypothetical protein